MLKFEIIESTTRIFRNNLIKAMIEHMKFSQGIEISWKNRVAPVFIVAENRTMKVSGGACLLKKNMFEINEDVREILPARPLYSNAVWECSSVYLNSALGSPLPNTPETEVFFQSFYQGLYEALLEFGEKKDVSYLIMQLSADTYVSIKKFSSWPYIAEFSPQNSCDGLFHGILPLTRKIQR